MINNASQYAPYKTYQQSNNNYKPPTNTYKPPANNGYNVPANNYNYKPNTQYDNGVVNADTAIAWAKKFDADKNGGLNRDEIIKTANEAQKYDKGISEFFNTFIYGGKNKQGFIFDPNKDRLLNFHEIAALAGKDGYANGITAKDFQIADPKQYQPGGNNIPPYGKQPWNGCPPPKPPVCQPKPCPPPPCPPQPPVCQPKPCPPPPCPPKPPVCQPKPCPPPPCPPQPPVCQPMPCPPPKDNGCFKHEDRQHHQGRGHGHKNEQYNFNRYNSNYMVCK